MDESGSELASDDHESQERPKTPEQEILNAHRIISHAVLAVRKEIIAYHEQGGFPLDRSGWRVLAFDASRYSPEDASDIDTIRPDLLEAFELDFHPLVATQTKRADLSPGEDITQAEFPGSGFQETQPESFSMIAEGTRINGRLLPIGPKDPRWVEIECGFLGEFGAIPSKRQAVISSIKAPDEYFKGHQEVVFQYIRPADADQALERAGETMNQFAELASKLQQGEYHLRIFSNTDRRQSDMKPLVIHAHKKLGTDSPQDNPPHP